VQAKLKRNENLALVIKATQIEYAKALKGVWMERLKFASNKIMWHKEISLLTQYHDFEMIHGWWVSNHAILNLFEIQVL
jgi:hypothetical protein